MELTRSKGCILLVDETYRDLSYGGPLPLAASMGDHVISVSSLSKAYGIPGIRVGWLITSNKKLQDLFLGAKEQISICGSVVDEWIAEQVLGNRTEILTPTLVEMSRRLELVKTWIEGEELLEWVPPSGGVVCFPRMKAEPKGGTDGVLRAAAGRARHLCGAGALVRNARYLFPAGIWLADIASSWKRGWWGFPRRCVARDLAAN